MKIVPAILTDDFETFLTRVRQAEEFTDFIQIDFMDGEFVSTRSFDLHMINDVDIKITFEAHLMMQKPLEALRAIRSASLKKALFHIEAAGNPLEFITEAKNRGLDVGIALRPDTPLESVADLVRHVDSLLFLTVDPGQYGSPFKPEVINKLSPARLKFPHTIIGVDGGVSLENLHIFYAAGIDYVCIGSRIFAEGDPGKNFKRFNDWLIELETSK